MSARFALRIATAALLAAALRAQDPLTITSGSQLTVAQVGKAYTFTFQASGGVAPYLWVANGGLPAGLSLDLHTGTLGGTPKSAGNFLLTIQVSDSGSNTTVGRFALLIGAGPPAITTASPLFSGRVNETYAQTFSASGGTPPYQWALLSTIPPGMSFNATSGGLSGTPATAGTYSLEIQVTDSAQLSASETFTLVIDPPAPSITTAGLPPGVAGVSYNQQLTAAGGTPPYTWALSAGAMPGLTLDPAHGSISGTPSATGSYPISVRVTDSAGQSATKSFSITVSAGSLKFDTPNQLPDALLTAPFSQTIQASGGIPPFTWSANGLPDGLSMDAATGAISGTPAAAGPFAFTVRVIDSARNTIVDLFHLNVRLPALPAAALSGLPATAAPADQLPLQVTIDSQYAAAIAGQAILSFTPDSGAGDGTIQFMGGGRTANFTIAAGDTTATSTTPLIIQTGTVAGSITVSLRLTAGGIDITPTPAPSATTRIGRGAPVIQSATVNRSGNTISIVIAGYSTAREVTQASFTFAPASNQTLNSSTVNVSVENLFGQWFQDPASSQYGSVFLFTQDFTIQGGDASAVTPQSVTLTNRAGSATANITQ